MSWWKLNGEHSNAILFLEKKKKDKIFKKGFSFKKGKNFLLWKV